MSEDFRKTNKFKFKQIIQDKSPQQACANCFHMSAHSTINPIISRDTALRKTRIFAPTRCRDRRSRAWVPKNERNEKNEDGTDTESSSSTNWEYASTRLRAHTRSVHVLTEKDTSLSDVDLRLRICASTSSLTKD